MEKDNYIEIEVPINDRDTWMTELRDELRRFGVKWQNGFYHITLAFIHGSTDEERSKITAIADELLAGQRPYSITFGEIDAFTTKGRRTHIIFLRPTENNVAFTNMVQTLRNRIKDVSNVMEPDFQLHITLGRVDAKNVTLAELKKAIEYVDAPDEDVVLRKINHRLFKDYGKPLKCVTL